MNLRHRLAHLLRQLATWIEPPRVTIALKWELGGGDEDAIRVRCRRDIAEAARGAKEHV